MSDVIQSTTQQFLDIYDITNNFVIMKNGTVSTILTVDAMNFGLLAEEEQDAIMYAYAGLLNSINYTIQIIIHSQTKDVTSYLKVLQEQEVIAETETMRRRIRMYREFVGNLIHERNVLDKKFYVVIPASALEMGFLATSSILPGSKEFDVSTVERSLIIEKAKNLLDPKRDHLIAQFARIGLFSRQLSTQEIIQLFYIRYNPEAVEGQQIGESTTYSTPLVKASLQETFMNTAAPLPVTPPPLFEQSPPVSEPVLQAPPEPAYTQTVAVQDNTFTTSLPAAATTNTAASFDLSQQLVDYAAPDIEAVPEIHIAAPEVVAELTAVEPITEPAVAPAQPELVAAPPISPLQTPPVYPAAPGTEPETPAEPSEQQIQDELNAALQTLDTAPATATSGINPALKNDPTSDLPPLPEI